ncbi:MAG: hypothetical protein LBO68_03370, partial [Synergistaceae bacterium]|nr:hypothetical protein [Synergistaceae bacterium]
MKMKKDDVNKAIFSLKKRLASSFLFVFFLAFFLVPAFGLASFALVGWAAENRNVETAWQTMEGWLQISTENAGTLSLPRGWNVVSKDDPAERSPDAERMFHVQQALYAQYVEASADTRGTLQVFSIWNADREGKILPLPPRLSDETNGDLAAGLIGARYGKVVKVDEDLVSTALEDLDVATYEAEITRPVKNPEGREAKAGRRFRYKCASLYYGDKRVLVLVKYLPEGEEYWSRRFETLLDVWVASLTLTPRPLTANRIPLPETVPPPLPAARPAQSQGRPPLAVSTASSSPAAATSETTVQKLEEQAAPSFVLYGGSALAALVVFLAGLGKISAWRRKQNGEQSLLNDLSIESTESTESTDSLEENPEEMPEKAPDEESEESEEPAPEGPREATPMTGEILTEENLLEENLEPREVEVEEFCAEQSREVAGEALGETSTETFIGASIETSIKTSIETFIETPLETPAPIETSEEAVVEDSIEVESEDEIDTPEADEEEAEDEGVRLESLPLGSPFDQGETRRTPAKDIKELGFDKVYDLLNRALTDLDAKVVTKPQTPKRYAPRNAMPNLPKTLEILDGLDAMFGESFVLETLKGEVLKALELKAGTPALATKDATPECFVL